MATLPSYRYINRAGMTVASAPGIGTISLGVAISPYQTFAAAGALNGELIPYLLTDGAQWELGHGGYVTAGAQLQRTTIHASTSGGAAISASASAKVFSTYIAEDLTHQELTALAIGTSPADDSQVFRVRGASAAVGSTSGAFSFDWVAAAVVRYRTAVSGTNWKLQTSPDGAAFTDALVVDAGGVVASVRATSPLLGVNATPDATNKLSVNSSAILLNNVGNGVQVKVNKAAAGDTASFLFQTGFSGRAEIGAIGDDKFQFKVSADGSAFYEALRLEVDAAAGLVSLPGGRLKFPATQNPSSDANTLDDYEEGSWTPALSFGGLTTGIVYSVQSGGYTKIGNRVQFFARIILTSKGTATGAALITGLPFTQTVVRQGNANVAYFENMAAGFAAMLSAYINPAATTITPFKTGGVSLAQLQDTDFTNTTKLFFGGTIEVS